MSRSKQASSCAEQAVIPRPPGPLTALVGDVEGFAASVWGQHANRTKGDPSLLDLLGTSDVDTLLSSGLRRPHFRVIRDGATLPAADVTRRVRAGGTTVDDFADPDRITDLLAGGASLVLQGLEHIRPQVADFANSLAAELGHKVQANAYLSPPQSAGLAAHTDTHDVFAVQLFGYKVWTVDGLDETATQPGDVLYIPAGVRHAARTVGSWSLHLTIGVHALSVGAALRRAVARAVALDAALRRPLPIAFAGHAREQAARQLSDARARLIELLSAADIEFIVDAEAAPMKRQMTSQTHPFTEGRLGSLVASTQLTLDSTIVAGASMAVATVGEESILVTGGRRTLTMPSRVTHALEYILSGRPCRVAHFPQLDDESRLVLGRRLLAEGVVAVTHEMAEEVRGGRSESAIPQPGERAVRVSPHL